MQVSDFVNAEPEKVLKSVFGYDSFRLLQKDIISNVLAGKDTLAVMPTGGGKSLCYQIPALIFDGLTVVVSPLISLMQDQVASLNAAGVPAVFLNSTVEWADYLDAMNAIRRGEIKIVYVSPEGLQSAKIRDLLHDERVSVRMITIDEAHCVSEWGHDFRPDYLEIGSLRKQFPRAVFLALTATATRQVRADIIRNLGLQEPKVLVSSFNRKNIYLNVLPKKNALSQVVDCIRRHWGESGIIYCFSRKQVDELTEKLSRLGYSVLNYHAGLSDQERSDHQTKFIRDEVQLMVATLAFGMGIDKPNVRFVVHYDMPKSLEQYYQEIGRAGRDGLASEAVLLYTPADIRKIRYFFDESADSEKAEKLLQGMIDYANSRSCRRRTLLAYFGESYTPAHTANTTGPAACAMDTAAMDGGNSPTRVCATDANSLSSGDKEVARTPCCDLCDIGGLPRTVLTVPAQKLMSCIIRTESRYGASYVIDVLLGSKQKRITENHHDGLSTYGIGRELTREQWFDLTDALIDDGYLVKTEDYGVLKITEKGSAALRNRSEIALAVRFALDSALTGVRTGGAGAAASGVGSESGSLAAGGVFMPKKRAASGANGGLMFPKPAGKKSRKALSADYTRAALNALEEKPEDASLVDALKKWRRREAAEQNVPPYIIFGDRTLGEIVALKPRSKDDLRMISGIGENKLERYGEAILRIVSEKS